MTEPKESEFSFETLNNYFWEKNLRKSCETVIDGILVAKTLIPFRSNSGKSMDFSVTFSWVGSDGVHRNAKKKSRFEESRRNDSERNWGLHE